MRCRVCGEDNPAGADYCNGCNLPLRDASASLAQGENSSSTTTNLGRGDHHFFRTSVGTWTVPSWYMWLRIGFMTVALVLSVVALMLAGQWVFAIMCAIGFGSLIIYYMTSWERGFL